MEMFNRLKEHHAKRLPFVVYRKPDKSLCTAILQSDKLLEKVSDFKESGFVISPFTEGLPTICIRPDETLHESLGTPGDPVPFNQFGDDFRQGGKEAYVDKIQNALKAIESGELQKVVLSRKISVDLRPDPFFTFQILLRQFPEAFCYFLYHPEMGIWMGASPETLLKYSLNEISTVSLAGTQKATDGKHVVWSPKEVKEQEYVTHFIEQALEGLADAPEVSEPLTVKAGNLLHLKTIIKASNPRFGLSQYIKALHPTPAVCGIPVARAKSYLIANEGYDRSYYTGFLGELNCGEQRDSHLFVNLRCMHFSEGQVHVYVGGGLVEGSVPEMEWLETVYKSESMLHLLRNSTVGLG